MIDKHKLDAYLLENIPISQSLGIALDTVSDDEIIIAAPFANNINHKMTVFGGSLHAVATLACWCLMYNQLHDLLGKIEIVISHSEVDYLLPVNTDFKAICTKPDPKTWDLFYKVFAKKGKARIKLNAKIYQGDQLAVDYQGTFVVLHTSKMEKTSP